MGESTEVVREEPLAIVRLNRPERLNAFNEQLLREVISALDALETDDEIRAVIICGAGRAFSSGYDLAAEGDESRLSVMQWKKRSESTSWRFARRVWNFRKPLIAAVHGYCLGGACEIAMLCDITIASEDCKFGEPEIRFASGPPALIMPWLVPLKIAKDLMYSGRLIDARRAYEIGMVNEVVPEDRVLPRARYHGRLYSRISPLAIQLMKEAMNSTFEIMGLQSALAYSANLSSVLDGSETEEYREFESIRLQKGLRAALEWRDQQFREIEEDV
jgi:enoyl-CoA hydratase/carnithine racemase